MKHTNTETYHFAEYVSPGHPDRLADAIAESIVKRGSWEGKPGHFALERTLIAVEVAVHDDIVFLDGRFAYSNQNEGETINGLKEEFQQIVRDVYKNAGYNQDWYPNPKKLKIRNTICIEYLQEGEAEFREYSDDQNVVIGYADPNPGTNHLPPAHYIANRIGRALWEWRKKVPHTYGPDFKVLPCLKRISNGSDHTWKWERLTLSVQHKSQTFYEKQYSDLLPLIRATLDQLEIETGLKGIASSFQVKHFHLNGVGDFCQGGPEGDNGLSGKKLVVDHYGPDIPIGGGAICGKDSHKIDRVGPLRARQLAKQVAIQHGKPSRVRLAWSPGDKEPFLVEASIEQDERWQFIKDSNLPGRDWFGIETIFNDLNLVKVDWPRVVLDGYFMDSGYPWEN